MWALVTMVNLSTTHNLPIKIASEIDGAIKILEILNLVEKETIDKRKKRKNKKQRNIFWGLKEKWAEVKRKKREEAYG